MFKRIETHLPNSYEIYVSNKYPTTFMNTFEFTPSSSKKKTILYNRATNEIL